MEPHEFKKLLDKYSKGECDATEEKIILEWYERIGEEGHRQPVDETPDAETEARLWLKINPRAAAPGRNHFLYFISAAATLLALAVIGIGLYLVPGEKKSTQANRQPHNREGLRNALMLESQYGR
jgi:hypothetical protein